MAPETPRGAPAGAVLGPQSTASAIIPRAVERPRERLRGAGARSDLRDARVRATPVRTPRASGRPLSPDAETAQERRALTRRRTEAVRTCTPLGTPLTARPKASFPEVLTLFADPDRPGASALLQIVPTLSAPQAVPAA